MYLLPFPNTLILFAAVFKKVGGSRFWNFKNKQFEDTTDPKLGFAALLNGFCTDCTFVQPDYF
jgi:hypothetical protein